MIAESTIPPELVEVLAEKTKRNEIQWALAERSKYTIDLPECKFSLLAADPDALTPDIVVEVDTPEGAVVGVIEIKPGDARYEEIRKLLVDVQASTRSRLGDILTRAAISIKEMGRWPVSTSTTTTPPPMPPRPNNEDARRFFEKVAGDWFLDFSRGTETLTIDSQGNYYIDRSQRGNGFGAQPVLKYRLTLEHCDPELEHVEVAKQELDGHVRQIEVLRITEDSMTGYAKHDAHALNYTRKPLGERPRKR